MSAPTEAPANPSYPSKGAIHGPVHPRHDRADPRDRRADPAAHREAVMRAPDVDDELEARFGYHPPATEREVAAHQAIRDGHRELAGLIFDATPPSREQSLALTKIEEAMMWANAAIARNVSAPANASGHHPYQPAGPR